MNIRTLYYLLVGIKYYFTGFNLYITFIGNGSDSSSVISIRYFRAPGRDKDVYTQAEAFFIGELALCSVTMDYKRIREKIAFFLKNNPDSPFVEIFIDIDDIVSYEPRGDK